MSAFKGTPGPWEVRGEESVVVETLTYCAQVMPALGGDNGYRGYIAYIQSSNHLGPYAIGRKEAAANAHLIAAAPTMHEYIAQRAEVGDNEAKKILESINAGR